MVVGALIIGAAIYASSYEGRTATVTTTVTVTRITTASGAVGTTSSVHIPVPFASTQNTSLGLILDLRISTNATGALIINTNATNLLNKMNTVTVADGWPISPGKTGSDPCGGSDSFPIQYAVFKGNYDASNYSAGSALTLYSTVVPVECVGNNSPPRYYLFLPLSDETSLGELVFGNYAGTGYWTGTSSSATFNPFPPGFYTVLAQDEWGQIAFVHFTLTVETTGTLVLNASEVPVDGL